MNKQKYFQRFSFICGQLSFLWIDNSHSSLLSIIRLCLLYHKAIFPWGIGKSFSFIYKAKIFLSLICGTTVQTRTGWLNEGHFQADDLVSCVHWLLLWIWGHLSPWGFPDKDLAGGLPGSVNENTNKLVSDGWYSVHIFAFPCSSKEVPPGDNWSSSPLIVLPIGLWMFPQTYLLHIQLTFLVASS